MSLNFPNKSRSYDATKNIVSFWGYDSAFEITFQISSETLQRFVDRNFKNEEETLETFDYNLTRIHKIATKAYRQRPGSFFSLGHKEFQ